MTKEQLYAVEISSTIQSLFDKESENFKYELKDIDATKFFTGMFLSQAYLYNKLCEQDADLLDFVSICNKLVFQYLQEKGDK